MRRRWILKEPCPFLVGAATTTEESESAASKYKSFPRMVLWGSWQSDGELIAACILCQQRAMFLGPRLLEVDFYSKETASKRLILDGGDIIKRRERQNMKPTSVRQEAAKRNGQCNGGISTMK